MDGGRDVFFGPLVRSLYSPVRHADIDRGSQYLGCSVTVSTSNVVMSHETIIEILYLPR